MNFGDAHSGSAVCTPTRYGLLTGRYCWRTRLKSEVIWEYGRPLIESDRVTMAEMFREVGYRTGMVGKWHLGMDWRDKDGKLVNDGLSSGDYKRSRGDAERRRKIVEERIDFGQRITGGPNDHGFDYYWGVDVPNFPPYVWIENDRLIGKPTVMKPESMFGSPGAMLEGWKLEGILPGLAGKASEWIEAQSQQETPFFLYLSLTSPHTPISPSAAFQGKSGVGTYGDFLMETDWVVGEVMKALKRSGVENETILVFTADNGTAWAAGFDQLEKRGVNLRNHFKGGKAQIHEGGHRVPMIVRWPGVTEKGTRCDDLVCLNDWMATFAELVDYEIPKGMAEDSVSFLSVLKGDGKKMKKERAVVHHDYRGKFAIRKGKWKWVENGGLFDLEADPKEEKDRSSERADIVNKLRAELVKLKEG